MKVLLWKPGIDDGTTGDLPHAGLGVLARDVSEAGHDAVLVDNHFSPTPGRPPSELLSGHRPDLLCLSLVSQEWNLPETQAMLEAARGAGIPVWLGGPHALGYGDLLEADPRLSKIVVGEADGAFRLLLDSSERLVHLGRVSSFGLPDFTRLENHPRMISYPLFTSRGCNYNCSFCAGTQAHGNRWRPRAIDDGLWDEIDAIASHYPRVKTLAVIDDAFTTDLDHAKNFLEGYLRRGYPYQLVIFNVRADQVDSEVLRLMDRAGVQNLAVGIESGDPEVFRLVRKGESLDKIRWAIGEIQKTKIIPWLNMVIGLPGDGPQAHRRSMDWVDAIPRPRIVQWLQFAPYRGTWAYRYFLEAGAFEDGFIPGLQAGRYERLPEDGLFDAPGFDIEQKMVTQLSGYLRCFTPLLALNEARVAELCRRHGLEDLYENWRRNAPIEEFLTKTLPNKIAKGQIDGTVLPVKRDTTVMPAPTGPEAPC